MTKLSLTKLNLRKWMMFAPALATFMFAWSGQTFGWMAKGTGPT